MEPSQIRCLGLVCHSSVGRQVAEKRRADLKHFFQRLAFLLMYTGQMGFCFIFKFDKVILRKRGSFSNKIFRQAPEIVSA